MSRGGAALLLALGAAVALGCPSAYQRTYDAETSRLEADERERQAAERARRAAEAAAHAEARRYVAVVYFEVGSAVIKEKGYQELDWFADKMRPHPQVVLEVRGFADTTGGDELNQKLSDERANHVARYLSSKLPNQVVPLGFASEFAADDNATAQGRLNNRRVEVSVR